MMTTARDLAWSEFCNQGGVDRDAFDKALDVYERHALFAARQQGYAERLHDEAAGIGADIDEWASPVHHTLDTLRREYARYQQHGSMHELVRAVGQILDMSDRKQALRDMARDGQTMTRETDG